MTKTIYSVAEAARELDLSPRQIRRHYDAGRIHGYFIPGTDTLRIPSESLDRFKRDLWKTAESRRDAYILGQTEAEGRLLPLAKLGQATLDVLGDDPWHALHTLEEHAARLHLRTGGNTC